MPEACNTYFELVLPEIPTVNQRTESSTVSTFLLNAFAFSYSTIARENKVVHSKIGLVYIYFIRNLNMKKHRMFKFDI